MATSLAKLGDSALPDIERELDSIEKSGKQWGFEFWLELAYARIKGPAAFFRLRRMEGPEVWVDRNNLDLSIALSLSLTSWVSDSGLLLWHVHCRSPEPRDALDQLILAWGKNDRVWLEASLGPDARAALEALLKRRHWAETGAELRSGKSDTFFAVGYRFDTPDRWSEPEETLENPGYYRDIASSEKTDLDTRFEDSSGADCGGLQVRFLKSPTEVGPGRLTYLVDNSDLEDLLRLIDACAGHTNRP